MKRVGRTTSKMQYQSLQGKQSKSLHERSMQQSLQHLDYLRELYSPQLNSAMIGPQLKHPTMSEERALVSFYQCQDGKQQPIFTMRRRVIYVCLAVVIGGASSPNSPSFLSIFSRA